MSDSIKTIIDAVKRKIPEQGPLEYFVHHNTLHHYQDLDFIEAVKKASVEYGAAAFMNEAYYKREYAKHTIKEYTLLHSCKKHIDKYQLNIPADLLVRLLLSSCDQYMLSEEAKRICDSYAVEVPVFVREQIKQTHGIDIEYVQQSPLLRFFSSYFDYGSAFWSMSDRHIGILKSFCCMYEKSRLIDGAYIKTLAGTIASLNNVNADECIELIIDHLKIAPSDRQAYIFSLVYRYKGWAGLVKSLEAHSSWVNNKSIVPSFEEFVAVLIVSEFSAIRSLGVKPSKSLSTKKIHSHEGSFIVLFLDFISQYPLYKAQLLESLHCLTDADRQSIWHQAMEQSLYDTFLSVYTSVNQINSDRNAEGVESVIKPGYQVVCCIDDREESFRRYLELDDECETFGYAGHFGLNIHFTGYFDKHPRALCPVTAVPEYAVVERPVKSKKYRLKSILLWGELQWMAALSSKKLLSGTVQTFAGFFTQIIPFVLDIISPKLTARIKHRISKYINQAVDTKVLYKEEDLESGIDFKQRTALCANLLITLGIHSRLSDIVVIVGHGSSSLNNPHEAAHDCGACGGGRGGPNARVMASILNEASVRSALKSDFNIDIPQSSRFIGAYHNTCNDSMVFYDMPSNDGLIGQIIHRIEFACQLDAKERCRRFASIPVGRAPKYYARKVSERSIDLRQPRPEYGHATNAVCILAPRSYSKQIFLDRRAFLVSYEAASDESGDVLKRLLSTAVPVCAGINLEYYFSYIDNEVYGCGTKLPHNITSLVGVINGYQSDLQLGLPWQMVEIHQPVRLLVLIACRLDHVKKMIEQVDEFSQLTRNSWIRLVVHNVDDGCIYQFDDNQFVPFSVMAISRNYHRVDPAVFNTRDHLEFGCIVS